MINSGMIEIGLNFWINPQHIVAIQYNSIKQEAYILAVDNREFQIGGNYIQNLGSLIPTCKLQQTANPQQPTTESNSVQETA